MEVSNTRPSLIAAIEEPLPEMAGNHLDILKGLMHQMSAVFAHIPVRGAVKTISPDIVFFVVFIGNGIHIRLPGHSGVERSIKYHALRDLRPKDFPACTDTIQFRAVMQRRQRNQAFNAFYNVLVYQQRLIENRAALGHPVTYSRNFTKLCNNAVFAIHQSFCNKTESIRMILHFRGGFYLPAVKGLMAENPLLPIPILSQFPFASTLSVSISMS